MSWTGLTVGPWCICTAVRTVACVTRYSHVVDWSDCGPWSICTAVRTVACITRYSHVVDWSDCGPWSICTAVRTVACVTRYSHVVDWSDCWSMMHLYSCQNCRLRNTLQSSRGLVWLWSMIRVYSCQKVVVLFAPIIYVFLYVDHRSV